jgi:hypothetical protein
MHVPIVHRFLRSQSVTTRRHVAAEWYSAASGPPPHSSIVVPLGLPPCADCQSAPTGRASQIAAHHNGRRGGGASSRSIWTESSRSTATRLAPPPRRHNAKIPGFRLGACMEASDPGSRRAPVATRVLPSAPRSAGPSSRWPPAECSRPSGRIRAPEPQPAPRPRWPRAAAPLPRRSPCRPDRPR